MKKAFLEFLRVSNIEAPKTESHRISRKDEEFISYLKIVEFESIGGFSVDEAVEIYLNVVEDSVELDSLSEEQLTCAISIIREAILFKRMRIEQLRNGLKDVLSMDKEELLKMRAMAH